MRHASSKVPNGRDSFDDDLDTCVFHGDAEESRNILSYQLPFTMPATRTLTSSTRKANATVVMVEIPHIVQRLKGSAGKTAQSDDADVVDFALCARGEQLIAF